MPALDRMTILSHVRPLAREEVPIPEWGGSVYVRVLTAFERDELEIVWDETKRRNFRARLAVATVCDEHGNDLFELTDIEAVGRQPAPALQRITEAALRLNGFTAAERERLEKNSENGQADDS
jgi:hypothetical protein